MRNYRRNSFQVLIPIKSGFPLKNWSVFMFLDSVDLIYQDILLFTLTARKLEPILIPISGNCTLYFNVLNLFLISNIFLPLICSY